MEDLWGLLVPDQLNETRPIPFKWKEFPQFFTNDNKGVFLDHSDVLKGRLKTTHTQGVVAQVEWVVIENNAGFTGIYESGSDSVLIRLSQAENLTELSRGLTPSFALKFLIDGKNSENIFGMHKLTANWSWDFF